MIEKLLNTTAAERKKMIADLKDARDNATAALRKENESLELRIKEIDINSDRLREENKDKIQVRNAVNKKIRAVKRKGNLLFFLALIVAAASGIWLFGIHMALGIAGLVLALAAFIFGIVVRSGWKKYADEQNAANAALATYDATQKNLTDSKNDLEGKIKENKSQISQQSKSYDEQIDAIKDFERYAEYYQWVAGLENGHVAVFVTGEVHVSDTSPRKPSEGKKYDSLQAQSVEIYFNEMLYGSGVKQYFSSQTGMFAVAKAEEGSTQKMQIRVAYEIANNQFERISTPQPMRSDAKSKFVWYHISTCGKGTEIYAETYASFDELREAVRLSKEDVIKKLM